MNRNGLANVLFDVIKFGFLFFIFLQLYSLFIDDLLYPYLGNFAYGTIMQLLFAILPLLLMFRFIKDVWGSPLNYPPQAGGF